MTRLRLGRQLEKSLKMRGFSGTLKFAFSRVASLLRSRLTTAASPADESTRHSFDLLHGVDTSGFIPLSRLDIQGDNWIHGVQYQAVSPATFQRVLEMAPRPVEDFTFIDMGAGKGRAVLLAAGYPFRRVIGVEFSSELVAIARRNLTLYAAGSIRCNQVDLVLGDAAEFELPSSPIVLYLYNPFDDVVMKRLVRSVRASLLREPRRIFVIYVNPQCADAWDEVEEFKRVYASGDLCIYDSSPQ